MMKTSNRWIVIIYHTLLAIAMMQVCRLLFYYFNKNLFSEVDTHQLLKLMQGGYILDMVAISYGFLLYFILRMLGQFFPEKIEMSRWYRTLLHISYFIPFTLFLFLNISDTGYFPYVLRRVNMEVFSEFEGKSYLGLYKNFIIEHWKLTLSFFIILILGILCYRLIQFRRLAKETTPKWLNIALSMVMVIFIFYSMRGHLDFKRMPVAIDMVLPYMEKQEQYPILLNTPIALSKGGTNRQEYHFYLKEELPNLFTPYYQAAPLSENDTLFGSMRGRNVMVIIMESMAREYIGFYNQEIEGFTSRTPFLDTFLPHTLYARYGFASGKRSVEAFPPIFASLPSFGGTYNDNDWEMSNYQHFNSFDTGLPLVLKNEGYHLKFYHGDKANAMGFFPFMQKLGVEEQYTHENYIAKHPNSKGARYGEWGIHDLPFEMAMAEDLNHLKEPFGAFFFSLSNHYPFKVPKKHQQQFEKGSLPIHQTAMYADYALQKFFEEIKNAPWYQNTLFVITADHTSLSDHPVYDNLAGHAAVPIALFDPQGKLKGEINQYVVQHADILPTLLYLLGSKDPVLSYGNNMFDTEAEHFGLNFFGNQYILFAKDVTITMNFEGIVKAIAPAPYLQTPTPQEPSEKDAEHYSNILKAIVQDYNNRIFSTSFSLKDIKLKPDLQKE